MDAPEHDDVVVLRSGQVEWRIGGLAYRMEAPDALNLAMHALTQLGWTTGNQLGLQVDTTVSVMPDQRALRDAQERLRANGKTAGIDVVQRPILLGTWSGTEDVGDSQRPRTRRFTKEAATGPTRPAAPTKKTVVRTIERQHNDPSIDAVLFADPEEQLRYEVQHAYLMTVPISQRDQWPMQDYRMLPSFLTDVDHQGGAVSRAQIVLGIVDVVSSRMNEVNSRRPRPLREGGGDDGRSAITRPSDGAMAWRANISSGTPAARRIMWWKTPAGGIELARLTTHDDFYVPER